MYKTLQANIEKMNRVKELQIEKEKEVERYRENAIRNMITKEKVQEAIAIISKSPSSKAAKDRIKNFNFIKDEYEADSVVHPNN